MNWFYSYNGQQAGPVSEEQLTQLLNSGTINHETLVWREGMTNWQPLGAVRPGTATTVAAPGLGMQPCAECGRNFAMGDMIRLNQSWVCAECKPVFLQKMSEGVAPTASGIWRMDKKLVTASETPFPDRCVKCNHPAHGYRLKRTMYWHHPAIYFLLFILCSWLIYLIVALIVRKKAILSFGLCEEHRAARKRALLIGWIGGLGSLFGGLILGAVINSGLVAVLAVLASIGCFIYSALKSPMLSATKIDKKNVWLKGAGPEFLAECPEWSGGA
jgi:GYF domain 2